MRQVILIDDNGQQHDITEAVREQMGEMLHENRPSVNQPMRRMNIPSPEQMPHMPGMENARPIPVGMSPEDFADDDNVRFIPVPAPMPGMNREVYGVPMNPRPMMRGGMPNTRHQQQMRQIPQHHMPNHQHRQMFQGGVPQMPNAQHQQMFRGGMFNRPIPAPEMSSPYYRTCRGGYEDQF